LYTKERFGNCRIRVVYKCKDAKSNSELVKLSGMGFREENDGG
jgi:hypothetical protein